MLAGSYIWGCYAAIKGRRMSLLVALFLHGIAELLASVVPLYWVFLFLKFLSGAALVSHAHSSRTFSLVSDDNKTLLISV